MGSASLCQSLPGCGPGGEGGVYQLNGQTYYGTLIGRIDNQTISPNYTNSSGGPVVAFAEVDTTSRTRATRTTTRCRSRRNAALATSPTCSPTPTPNRWILSAAQVRPSHPNRTYGQSAWDMRHNFVASYNWDLPFHRFLGAHRYSEGWHITGISRFNTGFPVNLQSSGDFALTNIGLDYPNQIGPIKS